MCSASSSVVNISTEELASHNHPGSISSTGSHTHHLFGGKGTLNVNDGWAPLGTNEVAASSVSNSDRNEAYVLNPPSSGGATLGISGAAGASGASITVGNRGSNVKHNNMQPYLVIYRFRRSA